MEQNNEERIGWICPNCKTSVSPDVKVCPNCKKEKVDECLDNNEELLLG